MDPFSNLHVHTVCNFVFQIARFKEQELARMRLEEKEKCRIELEATRREVYLLFNNLCLSVMTISIF